MIHFQIYSSNSSNQNSHCPFSNLVKIAIISLFKSSKRGPRHLSLFKPHFLAVPSSKHRILWPLFALSDMCVSFFVKPLSGL